MKTKEDNPTERENTSVNDKAGKNRSAVKAMMIGFVCGVLFIVAAKLVHVAIS